MKARFTTDEYGNSWLVGADDIRVRPCRARVLLALQRRETEWRSAQAQKAALIELDRFSKTM